MSEDYQDPFYEEAVAHVQATQRASIANLQRKFRIGYNRAARLMEQLEVNDVVSEPTYNGQREVLV